MVLYKFIIMLLAIKTATCSCNYEKNQANFDKSKTKIKREGEFPVCINESSGIIKAWQDGYYWTHNDSGGSPELYMVNAEGYIFDTLNIDNSINVDWEDLAKDKAGNIYVGDFGNNSASRKDLSIYKRTAAGSEKITFEYADQKFSKEEIKEFDCEAFFWANDSLYLFTKSWEKGVKGSKLYAMPDKEGHYKVFPKDQINLKAQITGADISPDGSKYALISYGKLFVFDIINRKIDFKNPNKCIKIGKNQTEAIVFENDHKIIFTNEQRKIFSIEI